MAVHNINPVREQLRGEILSALAVGQDPMTTGDLYLACPSATSAEEVSRVCYELRKKNLIADGGKVTHPRGSPVNSYRLPNTDDPRIEAAKPIKVEPKIIKNRQPAIKRKPAPGHPFAASIRHQEAHDSELIDALQGLAEFVPLPMADDDDVLAPKKICKCIRLNSLPPLPSDYRFTSIVASIFSEHDGETMDVHVVDEGGGPFVKIYTTGGLGFGLGDLALIGEAADALIKLLESDHA